GPRERLGELLEGLAEIDEQPAVGAAVGDLLRLRVERRLLVIIDDELRDRAALRGPRVLEDRRERRAVAVVAGGDVDLGALAELLGDDEGEHLALDVVGGDRLPDE